MNPTQRRKSTLGRRNRNVEKLVAKPLAKLPLGTPGGLRRFRGGANLKASHDFMLKKKLFSTNSSEKKNPFGSSSRATYCSPNDSQCSYQSDNSLNLTGVQSLRIPSPDYKNTTSNPTMTKSYQDYTNMAINMPIETSLYLKKSTTWDGLEPPLSPPPSEYDRIIQQELASIKPPVDPDDLINLRNLTIDEHTNPRRACNPVTSTVNKEVGVTKFSPHLSSTCVYPPFMLIPKKHEKPNDNVTNPVKTSEKIEISNHSSLNHKSNNSEWRSNSSENQNLIYVRQVKSSLGEKNLSTLNHTYSLNNTNEKCYSNTDQINFTVNPINHVNRCLQFDQSEFIKPLESSKSHSIASAVKYFESSKGTRLLSKPLDSTLSCELNHSLSTSNALPSTTNDRPTCNINDPDVTLTSKEDSNVLLCANKDSERDRKLSVINETTERDTSNEDLNSTDSFILAEQTIIDQDQYTTDSLTRTKASKSVVKNKHSMPEVNETSGSNDKVAQAIVKVDTILNKISCLRSEMNTNFNEFENELKSVKTSLQKLTVKQNKSMDDGEHNKENISVTETKKIRSKWFNEMKSENPNLLKTPNPARQSVHRMSLANQSIMTPHSLSVVISDQIDDLFD